MTTVQATGSGRSAHLPSSWDEMSPRQIRMAFREFSRSDSPLEFNFRMMLRFLGIRPRSLSETAVSNLYLLCEQCLGFLLAEKDRAVSLAFGSAINPMPRVGRLFGPGDMLQNLTFGEFRHAAMAFQTFSRTENIEDLDELVGILYRSRNGKENLSGRRAAPLGSRAACRDRKRAARMPAWKKSLVLTHFCACMKHLQEGELFIDGELVELRRLFSGQDVGGPPCTWNDLAVQLAKDNVIGNIDRVDAEPLYSVLRILWTNYKEVKRYEKITKT